MGQFELLLLDLGKGFSHALQAVQLGDLIRGRRLLGFTCRGLGPLALNTYKPVHNYNKQHRCAHKNAPS